MNRPGNEHGGDWTSYEIEYGKAPLDFSMNVNPLGMSEKVREAIAEAAETAERYPDPECRKLRDAIAEAEGVRADRVFCGAGAADVIYRLAKAAKVDGEPRLLITAPTFSEYEEAFASEGWHVERWLLKEEEDFAIGEDLARAIGEAGRVADGGADMLFLCEPNNPTGVATDRKLLEEILAACEKAGTTLVIDECFNGFLDDPEGHTMKGFLDEHDNLIILKAFTKLYGMAGVRLGYCLCANPETAESLAKAGAPWNVSSLAQAAGIAALGDGEHAAGGRRIVREERQWLKGELLGLGFGRVYGEANYLLFKGRVGLDEELRSRGILIRNCDNYHGLGEGWYRIAVRKHDENMKLIENMKLVMETDR
ncbi:MAG: pyridoxal phosphate-dependent aminotransferase [Bacillota bacterium]